MTEAVSAEARAKANLFLRVLARESDGYHSIETLFCRLELADTLSARRTEGTEVSLVVEGADTGPTEENLALRAARLVLENSRTRFGVELALTKRVPVGAGLGGGSADAAAALGLVNALGGNAIPRSELLHLAARLGADVPFCLSEAPLAIGWSHGERMMALPALPRAPVLLLTPPVPIRTVQAYGWIDETRPAVGRRGSLLLDAQALAGWSDVARMAGNDFESVVFGRHPVIREAFEALARTRPLLCRMSGSGSTLLAVYRSEGDREDARMMLGKKHGLVTPTSTM
ncbi:MAG TPA: 4-(cytidine 5'-diphospho)-2-C-methyl-D-erythritol kinase [Gemmatimonadales bacterium]|nr:4-(cytidine 5'-diphospho)-2-C-methyl-D-erythritol kinase [Gemmatimonadales bacterium]